MGLTSRLTGAVTGSSPSHQDKTSNDKAPEGAAADDTESVFLSCIELDAVAVALIAHCLVVCGAASGLRHGLNSLA